MNRRALFGIFGAAPAIGAVAACDRLVRVDQAGQPVGPWHALQVTKPGIGDLFLDVGEDGHLWVKTNNGRWRRVETV
jgi:hypothetical protein